MDAPGDVIEVPEAEIEPPPGRLVRDGALRVRGIACRQGENLLILDPDGLA